MNRKISFDRILDSIVDKNSISKVFARSLVNEMAALIQQGLLRDNVVNLSGLGIFKLRSVPARPGRNIQTGDSITIPAHRKVLFKPEKHLRELINKKYAGLTPKILDDIFKKPEAVKQNIPDQETIKPSFFTEAFDKFDEEQQLSDSPKFEKIEKKETVVKVIPEKDLNSEKKTTRDNKEEKTNAQSKSEPNKRSAGPIIYSVLAILIIIFLFIQFSGDDIEIIEPVTKQKQELVQKTETQKEIQKPQDKQEKLHVINYTAKKGDNLWNLAFENYKDGYLWPLILQANTSIISNPDLIEPESVLKIPVLPTAKKLSKSDYENLAKGHFLAYIAYKKHKNMDALNHLFVAHRYDPEYVKNSDSKIDNSDMKSLINLSSRNAR